MIEPEETLQDVLISEATTTLVDLAKLSQHAGMVSGDAFPGVANEMLVRLLLACHARQGAILLIAPGEPSDGQPPQQPEQVKDPRIFALHGMRAEEVHSLLRIGSPTTQESGQITNALPCWITYSQPLIKGQSGQSLLALLVVGWAGLEHDICADAMAWGQQMLPFLIDAVASVIVAMLQAERLNELEQRSTRESLEKINLLKAELLATISHELRSPLASIKGYAAMLLRYERRLRREERHQFLLTINEGTVRLEHIVESLLEISQLETEGIILQVSPVNVPLLVQETMRAAEERLSAQLTGRFSFSLLVEDGDGRPDANIPRLQADRRRLREALDNLLENAINYSPEGGTIAVVVRTVSAKWPPDRRPVAQALGGAETTPVITDEQASIFAGHAAARELRSMLEICVVDTGIGIAQEHIERIFERFYRVDMRLTREVNGLGLGLAICKRIIELHDGAIWAEILPQGGSVFRVLLPFNTSKEG